MQRQTVIITRSLEKFYWYADWLEIEMDVIFVEDQSDVRFYPMHQSKDLQKKFIKTFGEFSQQTYLLIERCDIQIINTLTLTSILNNMEQEVKEQFPDGWLM